MQQAKQRVLTPEQELASECRIRVEGIVEEVTVGGEGGGVLEASQGRRTRIPGGEGVNVKNREQKSTIA